MQWMPEQPEQSGEQVAEIRAGIERAVRLNTHLLGDSATEGGRGSDVQA